MYEQLGVSFDSATPSPVTPVLADPSDDGHGGNRDDRSNDGTVSPPQDNDTPTQSPTRPSVPPTDYPVVSKEAAATETKTPAASAAESDRSSYIMVDAVDETVPKKEKTYAAAAAQPPSASVLAAAAAAEDGRTVLR